MAVREAGVGKSEAGTRAATSRLSYDLMYLDDNNRECEVSREDIKLVQRAYNLDGNLEKDERGAGVGGDGGNEQLVGVRAMQMESGGVRENLEAKTTDKCRNIQKVWIAGSYFRKAC